MSPACDILEARGEVVDRFGDKEANPGEYNNRHNATFRAVANMVRAVTIGYVVLGDKEHPDHTAHLNVGYAVDIAELDIKQDSMTRSTRQCHMCLLLPLSPGIFPARARALSSVLRRSEGRAFAAINLAANSQRGCS